jgi:hypothetical protein
MQMWLCIIYPKLYQFFYTKYEVLSIEHPMLDGRLNLTQMKMILTSVSPDHLKMHSELNYQWPNWEYGIHHNAI